MSDDQIIALSRALAVAHLEASTDQIAIDREATDMGDILADAVRDMGSRDPERAKRIIEFCTASEMKSDWAMAAWAVTGLVEYDYQFVRDTLIGFVVNPKFAALSNEANDFAKNLIIPDLMHDHLTREQVADFNAALMDAGAETPIMPSVDLHDPTNNPWFNR
ncbi:hypothetical protein [Nocardia brasiliensis]